MVGRDGNSYKFVTFPTADRRFKYSIICIFDMNYLIFDPEKEVVDEWEDLYYSKKTLSETINLIKETNMFIQFI